ncbi:transketolase, partial [Bacillaceae bacterium Marseille-Q3522]|nr:transketolase [Bacillaceae bacterium Marseille-Q3522]
LLYDSNKISLDGNLDQAFSEDVGARFRALGWQTLTVEDGNNLEAIDAAITLAKSEKSKPTLIEVKTVIGYGSPHKAGTSAAHGAPLGAEEAALTKKNYHWELPPFILPEAVDELKDTYRKKGAAVEKAWEQQFYKYSLEYLDLAKELKLILDNRLPENWDEALGFYPENCQAISTRDASGKALNQIAEHLPTLIGGSADLSSSNKTRLKSAADFKANHYGGKNIWFGVREFAMGGILNGMALHGGVQPFGGTFFVFSDYLRSSIRTAALMGVPVTYVMTHDSIAVGEDGPTHEPIEQLASFRVMPGLIVIRPADANEIVAAYRFAFTQKGNPVMLVLSRQSLPILPQTRQKADEGVRKGAYVLAESENQQADIILIGTGSEVSLLIEAREVLKEQGYDASVVSIPSWELYEKQPESYKETVLPKNNPRRLVCEMGSAFGWERYAGDQGKIIGIDSFGASAPGNELMKYFGFTVENIVQQAKVVMEKSQVKN